MGELRFAQSLQHAAQLPIGGLSARIVVQHRAPSPGVLIKQCLRAQALAGRRSSG